MSTKIKLWVGNIPYRGDEEMLKEFWGADAISETVIRRDDKGRSKGLGYIICADQNSAQKIMAKSGIVEKGELKEVSIKIRPWTTEMHLQKQDRDNGGDVC